MFSPLVHRYIFLFGLFALAFGMMVGTVPTSVPQIILASNWVAELNFRRKWSRLRSNRLFWLLSALYLIHVAGVFYSQDIDAALHDIRTKMPMMFLPLLFLSSDPLKTRELRNLLWLFIAGSFVNVAWCLIYSFVLHGNETIRSTSRFMSHIRLGLYLNLAIAACVYYGYRANQRRLKLLFFSLAAYFLVSMALLGLAGGLANFVILSLVFGLIMLFRQKPLWRYVGLLLVTAVIFITVRYITGMAGKQFEARESPVNRPLEKSAAGNLYAHFDSLGQKENGYYVLINIQAPELRRVWNRDFPADSFSYKPKHNIERYEVLVRYMSSKGLLKDSAGYMQLSAQDKKNILKNHTNYKQAQWSFLHRRTYELLNEYDEFVHGRSVNGHSFSMRLYFWKAALDAISRRPIFGAGTGDVKSVLDQSYAATDSPLLEEWRLRPHNQFLTVCVALGIVGLIIFLAGIFVPVIWLRRDVHVLYWPFLLLALVSFLFEDTLETQAGLTFFAFFNSLFLCQARFRRREIPGGSLESR